MNNDIQQLKDQVQRLQQKVDDLQRKFDMHFHDGNNSQKVNLQDVFGTFQTLIAAPTIIPTGVYDQIQIALISGTYYLYVYDTINKVWKKVTIS